jgi:hypothetical protein
MIRSVALQRAKELMDGSPGAEVTQELLEDRAILSLMLDNRVMETDFIESGRSITLPRRSEEYYDILAQDIKLGILVPRRKVEEERAKLNRVKGVERFVVLGYDEDRGYDPSVL